MDLAEEFRQLKTKAVRINRKADEAAGVVAQLSKEIEEEFNVSTEAGSKLLAKFKKLAKEAEETVVVRLKEFETKYGGVLKQ